MFTTLDTSFVTAAELVATQPPDLLRHSESVAGLAARLSIAAGCSRAEQERIRLGSLLHDIGKQFIPRSILEKEGRLTPAEFARIQKHPWIGYTYLNDFVSDAVILQTVLYHHERWNGTGYPHGLKGDHIPLEARICALADVWDALVSDRCYRSAWNATQAMELIWAGAGSLFDPMLASQFLSIVEDQYLGAGAIAAPNRSTLPLPAPFVPAGEPDRGPETHRPASQS
jgi:HD-GYP domain-containing protein (c-di-GMP phosphodiesterase class II)